MSSNQAKDLVHPTRKELRKRRKQEQKNVEPTQHDTKRNDEDTKEEDSAAKQPSRPTAEEQEASRYKWWDTNPGSSNSKAHTMITRASCNMLFYYALTQFSYFPCDVGKMFLQSPNIIFFLQRLKTNCFLFRSETDP